MDPHSAFFLALLHSFLGLRQSSQRARELFSSPRSPPTSCGTFSYLTDNNMQVVRTLETKTGSEFASQIHCHVNILSQNFCTNLLKQSKILNLSLTYSRQLWPLIRECVFLVMCMLPTLLLTPFCVNRIDMHKNILLIKETISSNPTAPGNDCHNIVI